MSTELRLTGQVGPANADVISLAMKSMSYIPGKLFDFVTEALRKSFEPPSLSVSRFYFDRRTIVDFVDQKEPELIEALRTLFVKHGFAYVTVCRTEQASTNVDLLERRIAEAVAVVQDYQQKHPEPPTLVEIPGIGADGNAKLIKVAATEVGFDGRLVIPTISGATHEFEGRQAKDVNPVVQKTILGAKLRTEEGAPNPEAHVVRRRAYPRSGQERPVLTDWQKRALGV